MLKAEVIGNIGSDVEIKQFKSGHQYASFVVAHDRGKDKPATWVRVSWMGGVNDPRLKYITKGAKVSVHGDLAVSAYTDKNGAPAAGVDIYADSVEIVLFAKKDEAQAQAQAPAAQPAPAAQAAPRRAPLPGEVSADTPPSYAGPGYVPNAGEAQRGPCPIPGQADGDYFGHKADDLPF